MRCVKLFTDFQFSRGYIFRASGASPVPARFKIQQPPLLGVIAFRQKLAIDDDLGNPTGEEAFNYLPKSFLVVGSLSEFVNDHGVNQDRYRSFELFRRSVNTPEILTFDELYERARFIVEQHET